MQASSKTIRAGHLVGLFAAAGLAAGTAGADTYGYFNDIHDCYMFVHSMPDFDQKRDAGPGILGLPENSDGVGGGMFCVPTAATDLLGYVNRHGYPNAWGPGIANFEGGSLATYNGVTNTIDTLGILMGTDPDGGTSGSNDNIRGNLQWVLNISEPGAFDVCSFRLQEDWAPKTWDMLQYALGGGVVMFCYGRWEHDGAVLTERDGGHCVALTRVDHRAWVPAYDGFIGYANPSNSSYTLSQAAFSEQSESVHTSTYFDDGEARLMSRINFDVDDPEDTRLRLIDSSYVIFPREGFSNWPNTDDITHWGYGQGQGGGTLAPATWNTPDGTGVAGIALQPDHIGLAVATFGDPQNGGRGHLYLVNTNSNDTQELAELTGARSVVFGRDRSVYVLAGSELICYSIDRRNAERARVSLPAGAAMDAIAYDDSTDEVVAVSGSGGLLARYSMHLAGGPTIQTIPGGAIVGTGLAIDVNPEDGSVWIAVDSADAVTQYVGNGSGGLIRGLRLVGTGHDVAGCSVSREGTLYTSVDGKLSEFAPDGHGGLVEITTSRLMGISMGDQVLVSRGRTNFDPAIHSGPGWYDMPADEVEMGDEAPPCRVDYAIPFGTLDFFDVAAFLTRFSGGHPDADFAAPFGVFDFFDLAAYLAEFSAGCP